MRTIAIGDIHGCLTSLRILECTVPLRGGDLLITLGDYVDRGPQSSEVLDWLIAYRERGGNLISVMGNHELMMLRAREGALARNRWLANGGLETLRSYSARVERSDEGAKGIGSLRSLFSLDHVPDAHWSFLESCCPYHETETHVFVHANLQPELALQEQTESRLFWQRFENPQPHVSGKHMVCGHTPQESGEPKALAFATCIDTFVYDGGWLTALDVQTGQCWQANERGEARTGYLALDS